MPLEIVLGRALAVFAHPLLAWRRLSPKGRVCLTGTYVLVSYLGVLATLVLFGR